MIYLFLLCLAIVIVGVLDLFGILDDRPVKPR